MPHTSPHVSLKQCSYCLPIHYLSLSFNWTRAKSLCFLCMLATDLQGNRCRRLQCTAPYVITALIKTITAAHSFHSYGVVCELQLHLLSSRWTFFSHSPASLRGEPLSTVCMQMNFAMFMCASVCMHTCSRLITDFCSILTL